MPKQRTGKTSGLPTTNGHVVNPMGNMLKWQRRRRWHKEATTIRRHVGGCSCKAANECDLK
eukprot:12683919-Alexandrium_andersonii.AAC.1